MSYSDQLSFLHTLVGERVFPLPGGGEYDSVFGEISSGCSSHVDSPISNGTTYGAQSPTLLNTNFEPQNSLGSSQLWSSCSSPFASENSIFESMNRATPYSPEEKKERIERYRSKRNLRNFNKKIKYECRKTLADSRPRVRGRFARNGEIEKVTQRPFEEEDDDDYYSWITILDALNKSDNALISSF